MAKCPITWNTTGNNDGREVVSASPSSCVKVPAVFPGNSERVSVVTARGAKERVKPAVILPCGRLGEMAGQREMRDFSRPSK